MNLRLSCIVKYFELKNFVIKNDLLEARGKLSTRFPREEFVEMERYLFLTDFCSVWIFNVYKRKVKPIQLNYSIVSFDAYTLHNKH